MLWRKEFPPVKKFCGRDFCIQPEPPEAVHAALRQLKQRVLKKFDFKFPPELTGILILTGADSPPLHAIFSFIIMSLLRLFLILCLHIFS